MEKMRNTGSNNTLSVRIINRFLSHMSPGNHIFMIILVVVLMALLMTCGCMDQRELSGSTGLTILVDNQDQMETVRDIAVSYQNRTGTQVSVKEVPADWNPESGTLSGDLLVTDMNRIPVFAGADKLVALNPHLNLSGSQLNWTLFERPTLVMVGEYPEKSGDIYALPFSQDALGIAYRADLFDDPVIAEAFCKTQGYPLGIPGTYEELNTLASYFSDNTSGRSGIGFAGLNGSDPRSSPWLSIVSSYGSRVMDRPQGKASGIWNSSKTESALLMLQNLSKSEPDGALQWGDREVIDAFNSGKVTMAITWFSRFPEIEAAGEEHNLSVGFIPLPGQTLNGVPHRGITVKMNGIGMVTGGSQERALAFLTWFYSPEEQLALASSGQQPSVVTVLDSYQYLSMNLYNRVFPESIRMGVTETKGKNTGAIRQICEETVREFLSSRETGTPPQQPILDISANMIDELSNN